jgi:hypothetical protein
MATEPIAPQPNAVVPLDGAAWLLQDTQSRMDWQVLQLAEIYLSGKLERMAYAITGKQEFAERGLSNATLSIMQQIRAGKCRADNARQFGAWVRKVVERQCKRLLPTGDKAVDSERRYENRMAKLREFHRPRQRRTSPPVCPEDRDESYERNEIVGLKGYPGQKT